MSDTQNTIDVIVIKTNTTDRTHPDHVTINAEPGKMPPSKTTRQRWLTQKAFMKAEIVEVSPKGLDPEACDASLANILAPSCRKGLHDDRTYAQREKGG